MRIDGYYNKEPIGLSDNPEEATFSFAHVTIPLDASLKNVWKNQKAGAERKITSDSEHDGKEKDGKEKGWRETFGLAADEMFSALHGS